MLVCPTLMAPRIASKRTNERNGVMAAGYWDTDGCRRAGPDSVAPVVRHTCTHSDCRLTACTTVDLPPTPERVPLALARPALTAAFALRESQSQLPRAVTRQPHTHTRHSYPTPCLPVRLRQASPIRLSSCPSTQALKLSYQAPKIQVSVSERRRWRAAYSASTCAPSKGSAGQL